MNYTIGILKSSNPLWPSKCPDCPPDDGEGILFQMHEILDRPHTQLTVKGLCEKCCKAYLDVIATSIGLNNYWKELPKTNKSDLA